MLVSTEWVAEHLDDPGLVVAESDEDVLLYETGHIPGAVKLDWHTELNDPVTRDYVDGAGFARLMSQKGISRDTTLVLYGDKNNWWAAYALWVCSLFGHPDLRLMDGGRAKWIAEDRPLTTEVPQRPQAAYPVIERDDTEIRAFRDQVLAHLGKPLIDVRSPGEYTGELLHMPDYPQEGALRGGHIPGAESVPWARAAAEDATFRTRAELEAIYAGRGGAAPRRRRRRLLPHRRAVQPHLVRAAPPARLPARAQLRRVMDRVGEQRPGAHHPRGEPVTAATLNPRLQEIADDFNAVAGQERLQLLLEFSQELPPLPARYAEQHDLLEPVPECQSPLFLAAEVDRTTAPCTCSSTRRRRRRPPAASPASCTPGWTGWAPTRSWPPRRSSPASSACRTWSARCGCAAWRRCWAGSSARSASSAADPGGRRARPSSPAACWRGPQSARVRPCRPTVRWPIRRGRCRRR